MLKEEVELQTGIMFNMKYKIYLDIDNIKYVYCSVETPNECLNYINYIKTLKNVDYTLKIIWFDHVGVMMDYNKCVYKNINGIITEIQYDNECFDEELETDEKLLYNIDIHKNINIPTLQEYYDESIVTEGVVYKISHYKTDKYYIGCSKNFEKRKEQHIVMLRKNTHHCKELNKFIKNDDLLKDLEFEIIERVDDKLFEREKYYINKYKKFLFNTIK